MKRQETVRMENSTKETTSHHSFSSRVILTKLCKLIEDQALAATGTRFDVERLLGFKYSLAKRECHVKVNFPIPDGLEKEYGMYDAQDNLYCCRQMVHKLVGFRGDLFFKFDDIARDECSECLKAELDKFDQIDPPLPASFFIPLLDGGDFRIPDSILDMVVDAITRRNSLELSAPLPDAKKRAEAWSEFKMQIRQVEIDVIKEVCNDLGFTFVNPQPLIVDGIDGKEISADAYRNIARTCLKHQRWPKSSSEDHSRFLPEKKFTVISSMPHSREELALKLDLMTAILD